MREFNGFVDFCVKVGKWGEGRRRRRRETRRVQLEYPHLIVCERERGW